MTIGEEADALGITVTKIGGEIPSSLDGHVEETTLQRKSPFWLADQLIEKAGGKTARQYEEEFLAEQAKKRQ